MYSFIYEKWWISEVILEKGKVDGKNETNLNIELFFKLGMWAFEFVSKNSETNKVYSLAVVF